MSPGARRSLAAVALDRAVVAISGFLLLSMGGAIVAAPLTVPLLIRAARRSRTSAGRALAALLAGATVAEAAWAAVYLAAGEVKPWIWLVPLTAALATAAVMVRP